MGAMGFLLLGCWLALGGLGPFLVAAELTVTIVPKEAVAAGAKWSVNGGEWLDSGATAPGLLNAHHEIRLKPVSGWCPPKPISIQVGPEGASSTVVYPQAATLMVTLSPDSARWQIDGGAWYVSGAALADLAAGAHEIAYNFQEGLTPPPTETVNLAAGQELMLERNYGRSASLRVNLSRPDARWKLDESAWQPAGSTVSGIPAGPHAIRYGLSPGWTLPPVETVRLEPGEARVISRDYAPAPFSIEIVLKPSAGRYRVNGGPWRPGGAEAVVPAGTYEIDYMPLPGREPPPAEKVTGTQGSSWGATRYYKPDTPVPKADNPDDWRLDTPEFAVAAGMKTDRAPFGSPCIELANGSFEEGTWRAWTLEGSGKVVPGWKHVMPTHRRCMAFLDTMGDARDGAGSLTSDPFVVPAGMHTLLFDYNFTATALLHPVSEVLECHVITAGGAQRVDTLFSDVNLEIYAPMSGFERGSGFRTAGLAVDKWAGTGERIQIRFVLKGRGALPGRIPGTDRYDHNPISYDKNQGTGLFLDSVRLSSGHDPDLPALRPEVLQITFNGTAVHITVNPAILQFGERVYIWDVTSDEFHKLDVDGLGTFHLNVPINQEGLLHSAHFLVFYSTPPGPNSPRRFSPPTALSVDLTSPGK